MKNTIPKIIITIAPKIIFPFGNNEVGNLEEFVSVDVVSIVVYHKENEIAI
jgi:hypothetical protein